MTDKVVACFVLYDEAKHVALMENRPEYNNGREHWVYPGGKLEPGESPRDAMIREMREEIACVPMAFEQLSEPTESENGWTCYSFLVTLWAGSAPAHVLDAKCEPMKWIDPAVIVHNRAGVTARQSIATRVQRVCEHCEQPVGSEHMEHIKDYLRWIAHHKAMAKRVVDAGLAPYGESPSLLCPQHFLYTASIALNDAAMRPAVTQPW